MRDYICMFNLDDKCLIPVGEPDAPVSVLRRQRRGFGAGSCDSSDHDHIKMHLTPSVINKFGKPPKRFEESFLEEKSVQF